MTTTAEKIAAYCQRLAASLQEQLAAAKGWPDRLVFPEPQDDDERTALSLFLAEAEKETGVPVRFITKSSHA